MQPARSPFRFSRASGAVDTNFTLTDSTPSSYPKPVKFNAAGSNTVWWAFRTAGSDDSPYLAWSNGPSVIVRCRDLVLRGIGNNELSYDGRATGPMGRAEIAVIDEGFVRRLWVWLKRAQREGRGVVDNALLSLVERCGRERISRDGLANAMIVAAWHTGGPTGGSRFSASSPGEVVYLGAFGYMPPFGVAMNPVDSPVRLAAWLNNLDRVPGSLFPAVDALRTDQAPAPASPPAPQIPVVPSQNPPAPQAPPVPAQSPPRPNEASPPLGGTAGGGQPGTLATLPVVPTRQTSGASALAGSIANFSKKAFPYAAGTAAFIALATGGYYLAKHIEARQ